MKKVIVLLAAIFFSSSFTGPAKAELLDRGSGLIYDNDLNIMWLQYANYFGETLTWAEANNRVDELIYQGYDDWRLPVSDASCSGYNCRGSEMGHLFYVEGVTSDSLDLFIDVRPYMYWSAVEYGPDTSMAWRFDFDTGYQGTSSKTYTRYAWAVRDGDSTPVVPEPAGLVLFIAGGLSLAAGRFRKK